MKTDAKALHQALTHRAVAWLKKSNSAGGHGCQIALSEGWGDWRSERPDAIGWRSAAGHNGTVLIEVKVSRADFLADARKPHRARPEEGMGRWRYFLCREGMIRTEELPDRWGLLWVKPRGTIRAMAGPAAELTVHSKNSFLAHNRFVKALDAYAFTERNVELEMCILARLLQRIPDLEAFNTRLREANNLNSHLFKQVERLRAERDRLRTDLILARFPDSSDEPTEEPVATGRPSCSPAKFGCGGVG